jgi:RNA-directed DNA polymerase
MNFSNSTTVKTERLKDTKTLAFQWETMDWCKIENDVNNYNPELLRQQQPAKEEKPKDYSIY